MTVIIMLYKYFLGSEDKTFTFRVQKYPLISGQYLKTLNRVLGSKNSFESLKMSLRMKTIITVPLIVAQTINYFPDIALELNLFFVLVITVFIPRDNFGL